MFDRSYENSEDKLLVGSEEGTDDVSLSHCNNQLRRRSGTMGSLVKSEREISLQQLKPYTKMFSPKIEVDQPPLICTQNSESLGDVIGWFRAAGLPVNICGGLSDLQYHLEYEDWTPSLIMIDLDSMADIAVTFCRMLNLRQEHPEIPIMLICRDNNFNDFTTDRFAIADIFLEHCQLSFDIEDYVAIAMLNNKRWRNRNGITAH